MAKKQTTGKPRKEREEEIRRMSRAEREQYYQRLAITAIGVVVGIIALVVIAALVYDLVIVPEQAITTVNDTEITTDEYRDRLEAERWFLANQIRQAYEAAGENAETALQILAQTNQLPPEYQFHSNHASFLNDTEGFGEYVLSQMELEVILQEEADQLGVEVDNNEIQSQVDTYITNWTGANLTPTPTQTPTDLVYPSTTPVVLPASPTPTETPLDLEPSLTPLPTGTPEPTRTPLPLDEVKATVESFEGEFYEDAEERADIERDQVEDIFYLRALREALREEITEDLPRQQVWSNSRHILFSVPEELRTQYTEDICNALNVPEDERSPAEQAWAEARQEADQVMASLQAGEPFAALAATYSDDPSAADNGLLGWSASDGYVEPFAEAINTADIGAYVGPVCTEFGWHIIQVLDRELRDIPEFEFQREQNTAYQEWEREVRSRATIERREDWQDRIPDDPSYEDLLGDIIPLN